MKVSRILCLVAAAGMFVGCSRDPEGRRDQHLERADAYFKEGKLAEASVEYRSALQYDPRIGRAYFRLGEIADKQEDPMGALQSYIRAAELLPKDIEAQLRAANFLIAARRYEDARTTALKAVQIDPKNVEAMILVGNASAGLSDYERAITELQAAQKLDAADPRIYNNLGWFEAIRGRSEQADIVFRNAVAAAPKSAASHLALANYLTSTGRRDEAEKSLRTAVAVEPTHVPALRAIGWFLTMSNRAKEAEPFLVAAAQHDPKSDSQILLADFYAWSGRDADAVRVLERLKASGGSVLADTRLASIAYRTDRARAEALVKSALTTNPKSIDARVLDAQMTLDAHKLPEAMTAIESLIKDHPRLSQAHFLHGRALAELGRSAEATKAFNEAIALNPRAVTARLFLAQMQLRSGRAAAAQQIANEVLKLAPGNPAARLMIVQTLHATGQSDSAARQLADLSKSYQDWTAVHHQAARLAVARSDWTAARAALDRLEALEPESSEAFEGRLAVDLGTKDYKSAFHRLDTRLAKDPKNERVLLVAGQVYAAAGDGTRAETTWKQLLSMNPGNNDAYDELGRLYALSGRLDAAEKQFADLAARSTEGEYGLILAGVLAHGQGKLDVARQRYEKVLAANPESPVAANNLAWIYAEQGGNLDMALNLAQTAKRLAPTNPNFIDTLGVVLTKKGLWTAAIAELEEATNMSPKNATIHLHLAQALVGSGKGEEARKIAQKALQIDPNFPEAGDARLIVEGKADAASRIKSD